MRGYFFFSSYLSGKVGASRRHVEQAAPACPRRTYELPRPRSSWGAHLGHQGIRRGSDHHLPQPRVPRRDYYGDVAVGGGKTEDLGGGGGGAFQSISCVMGIFMVDQFSSQVKHMYFGVGSFNFKVVTPSSDKIFKTFACLMVSNRIFQCDGEVIKRKRFHPSSAYYNMADIFMIFL